MRYWASWLVSDPRNRLAWCATGIQAGAIIITRTGILWGDGAATLLALTAISTSFILLGVETFYGTRTWNGLGRALTLLCITTGVVFIPSIIAIIIRLSQGNYEPLQTSAVGTFLRDISYIITVFAPVSLLGHLRHYRAHLPPHGTIEERSE